jgi:hypothetical protein
MSFAPVSLRLSFTSLSGSAQLVGASILWFSCSVRGSAITISGQLDSEVLGSSMSFTPRQALFSLAPLAVDDNNISGAVNEASIAVIVSVLAVVIIGIVLWIVIKHHRRGSGGRSFPLFEIR